MTDVDNASGQLTEGRSYFFLSYAHSPPLEGDWQTDPDQQVRQFFDDLTDAVSSRATEGSARTPGFFDKEIPVDSNWKESLSRAIGAAEVFVPLYSPGYVARYWPRREWACFYERLVLAGLDNPVQRFAPVLWAPLRDRDGLPGLDAALEVGAAESEYERSGLQALLTITPHRDSYRSIVNQVAERVVTLAEEFPLVPSEVPDIDETKIRFGPEARLAIFAVAVAAPTSDTAPAGSDLACYGDDSTTWRPFPGQELSLAEYAQQVAERFDFEVDVTNLDGACDMAAGRPGILLIDPWLVAGDDGRAALQAVLSGLPRWIVPLMVRNSPVGTRADELAAQVRRMLGDAGALPAEAARRASRSASSLGDFVAAVPALVAEAERRFLRLGGGHAPLAQSGGRRRLGDAAQPDTSTSAPHPAGEAPDA